MREMYSEDDRMIVSAVNRNMPEVLRGTLTQSESGTTSCRGGSMQFVKSVELVLPGRQRLGTMR